MTKSKPTESIWMGKVSQIYWYTAIFHARGESVGIRFGCRLGHYGACTTSTLLHHSSQAMMDSPRHHPCTHQQYVRADGGWVMTSQCFLLNKIKTSGGLHAHSTKENVVVSIYINTYRWTKFTRDIHLRSMIYKWIFRFQWKTLTNVCMYVFGRSEMKWITFS